VNALTRAAVAAIFVASGARASIHEPAAAHPAAAGWSASLADIRATAAMIPGRRPLGVNILKFAESRRPKNFSVSGAPAVPSVQARTVFQIRFADGRVMVDSGMDRQVHRFFGRGEEEPYDAAAASRVERALADAKLIVVTHEHGDHVAGVIRSPNAEELARKTILTREQVNTLMTAPQMPEIRLTDEAAARYHVVDYNRYLPLAPGMALIKAPGHTPGSQMIYVALESGREYLLIGDAAWHMDSVRQIVGKNAPWITEDKQAVLDQLRWLNELSRTEPRLVVIASHDDEEHAELIRTGVLGSGLE
jgi:glyoxylase-like metal-dependent hydrolase (beta-lactamase superfamily II)